VPYSSLMDQAAVFSVVGQPLTLYPATAKLADFYNFQAMSLGTILPQSCYYLAGLKRITVC
jgi:hypothetical protein